MFDYTTSAANRVKTADDGDGDRLSARQLPVRQQRLADEHGRRKHGSRIRPGADSLGDACDDDKDGDGYTAAQEAAVTGGKNDLAYCQIMRADVDNDGAVSILDLAKVAVYFTQTVPPAPERYKQDKDSQISILDLTRMAQVFTQHVTACP